MKCFCNLACLTRVSLLLLCFIISIPAFASTKSETLRSAFHKADPWEASYPDGSLQRSNSLRSGGTHTSIINRDQGFHYSYDRLPDGTYVNQHWTNHITGEKGKVN